MKGKKNNKKKIVIIFGIIIIILDFIIGTINQKGDKVDDIYMDILFIGLAIIVVGCFIPKPKRCDICFKEKKGIKKNNRGLEICADCRSSALKVMSEQEYKNANILEISYASKGGSSPIGINYCEKNKLSAKDALDLLMPDRENVELSFSPDEICYYQGSARSYKEKNIITKYENSSAGVNIHILKGLSIRTGGSTTVPIRENISQTYEGTFFITNRRFILLAEKNGFNIDRKKISYIEPFKNGFKIYSNNHCHTVITYDNTTIFYIIEKMNQYLEESTNKNTKKSTKTTEAEELKQFKELLDMGAITQEEYDIKKKEILNI